MKSRIAIICVALAAVFFIACPMPHVGVGKTKDATGTADQTAPQTTGGSISVVNDETRGQAVYINETGQRFDVVAPEYPGGPLVACVEMADFTLVPTSTDADPLPVKALVAGTRNDGTPGVWEIHSDDSIDLPQPAVDDSGAAKCIVGGDMSTLPPGVQMNLGWGFHVTAVSKDGKMLVGYADNPKGVTIGGVQILPGTTIGIYWRVYSLPYSRFCFVSAPHIIGSFTPQPLPPKWAAHWLGRSPLLQQLWQYINGTLQSYLIKATSVSLDTPQGMAVAAAESTGSYDVMGTDQDGLPANATIDKNGGVAIQVFAPDVNVSGVTVSTSSGVTTSVFTSDPWSVSAALTNAGTAQATSVIAQYWLSTSGLSSTGTFDTTKATLIDTSATIPSLQVGQTMTLTSPQTYTLSKLGITTAGTYYIVVTAAADPKNGEIDLTDNQAQAVITAQVGQTSTAVLTVSVSSITTPVDLFGSWSFNATVTNSGTGASTAGSLSYSVNGKVTQVPVGSIGPNGSQTFNLSGKVSDLTSAPGTYHITVTDGTSTADAAIVVTFVDLTVSVTPNPTTAVHLGGIWSTSATVTNLGTGTAGPSTLQYLVNGVATSIPVASIGPNGSQTLNLSGNVSALTSAPGTYHVTVIADALNVIPETNKANNTADIAVPVVYDVIIIDTYDPSGSGADAINSTYVELWSADGSTKLAFDDGLGVVAQPKRPPTMPGQGFAYVDYTGGLAPGVYYLMVRASNPGDTFGYGIRALTQQTAYDTTWAVATPAETASDSTLIGSIGTPRLNQQMVVGVLPTNPAPNAKLGRFIPLLPDGTSGVNWIRVTLP